MLSFTMAGSLLLFAQPILGQFNMYPSIDPSLLAASLNISSGCLTALNSTVNCDQTLFQMAGNADAYFWADDNATALCTSECLSSASSWWGQCTNACENDQLNAYGRLYPAETVPGRFLDGLNIVCLKADTDISQDVGINGTIISFTDIGGENSTANATGYGDQSLPDTPLERRQTSAASSYCLVQSYDWVGSDIIRPDCDDSANVNESQCIDPTDVPADNSRIANLYPDSLLCSDCFLKMFYLRLASPFLPDADQSDFMVDQWFDILDVCNANSTMPELLVRTLPWYEAAPGFSIDGSDNITAIFNDPLPLGANNSCTQRVITFANLTAPPYDYSTQTPCDVMPPYLELSTGDVQQMMGNGFCVPNYNITVIPSVCVPLPCNVTLMPYNTTCDQFAQSISTTNNTVTVTQLLSWNSNFIGLCTNTTGQYVCTDAPGGTYIPPPVSNATTSASGQQRGGGDGSGTATGSGGADGSARNSTIVQPGQTPPSPTQSGIPATCTEYAMAQSGDGCDSFRSLFGLTLQALVAWNPVLGANGANCQTLFWAGDYYCIGVSGSSTTKTSTTTTPTGVATPSPVQSGINPQCTKYAEALSGTDCTTFATGNNITPAQLYTWNPILGVNGANCNTELFANTYYCVGAPSGTATVTTTSTTTTPTGVATPSPVQSGINPQCTKYAEALSGTDCTTFATGNNITPAQLYTWNPILGVNGANCNTELFANTYYCVGAPSSTPTSTKTTTTSKTSSTTTTSVTAPGPTQSGITPSCNKFAAVVSGDGCYSFAQEHGITTDQLYAWNTMLGAGGANCGTALWLGNYYCIGVSS